MNKAYKKFEKLLKKEWRWVILVFVAVCFFIGTSSFNWLTQAESDYIWNSPDENANYIFAKLYGQTSEMMFLEKYNLLVDDVIQPRSFRSDGGFLKPVSFLGIILIYGSLVKLFSYKILPFLTPFFASISIIYFYLLIKELFGRKNALLSALLYASFPPLLYYSARSMFHNVLFISLLIIGLYYCVLMVRRKKMIKIYGQLLPLRSWLFASLGGFFIGLAIITRTSELIWLLPMLLLIWLFYIRKIGVAKLLILVSFLFLAMLPMFYWNQILYNSPLKGGYPEMNQAIVNITQAGTDIVKSTFVGELSYHKELLDKIKVNVFRFGLNIKQSLRMFFYYFVVMFYWIFWPAFIGLLLCLQVAQRWKKKHLVYFVTYVLVSVILIFYYGSWEFNDNPDSSSHTIGNSYTRYWLPVYLGALPLMSLFLIRFTRNIYNGQGRLDLIYENRAMSKIWLSLSKNFSKTKKIFWANTTRAVILIFIYFTSIIFVLYGSEEGLIFTALRNKAVRAEKIKVLELTESSSVIITQYHDKLLFPERKVIVGLFNDKEMNKKYSILADHIPIYYYNFTLPEIDLDYLNNKKLKEVDLGISVVRQVTHNFTLYKLEKIP